MMVVRSTNLLAAVVAAVGISFASAAFAQEVADGATAPELFDDPATQTEDEADDIFAGIDDQEPTPAETMTDAAAAEQPAEPAADAAADPGVAMPGAAAAAIAANEKVHELTERVAAMQTEIEELKAELNLLREAQARMGDTDFSTQALGAMAEDADLRSSMGEMLQGKVRLINNTGEPVVMYINGTAWTVVTGESFVHAPVGTVSFLHQPDDEPTFKGVQEWIENRQTGQFELEYTIGETNTSGQPDGATERSVLMKVPVRTP